MRLEKNESFRGVIRSVAHAHHPKGSVGLLELGHLFRVFGFFESFVHLKRDSKVRVGKMIRTSHHQNLRERICPRPAQE